MRRTAIMTNLPAEVMRRIRHFGDFVTVPLAVVILVDLAGMYRLHLVLVGLAAWTLLEYLVHRFVFHLYSAGRRLHQLHLVHPNDPDSERSSLSTPLLAFPIGFLLIGSAGVEGGAAIFAGLLPGYLVFIVGHYAVHRWPMAPITSPSTTIGSPPCISIKPCAVTAAMRPWLMASSSALLGFLNSAAVRALPGARSTLAR